MNTFRATPLRNPRRLGLKCPLIVGVCAATLTAAAAIADEPDEIEIQGVVRDFQKSHPDFDVLSSTGHVANNIALTTTTNRPIFTGHFGTAGFEVATQWRNKNAENIAPHLFYNGAALQLGSPASYNPDNVNFYSWNASEGDFDPNNLGPEPEQVIGAPMPTVNPPSGLPPHPNATGGNPYNFNLTYPAGTHIIESSFQVRSLTTGGQGTTLQIAPNSDVIIYTSRDIDLGQDTHFVVPETSTLQIFFDQGGMTVGQGSTFNMGNPLDPARCIITNLGNSNITFNQTGGVCAQIISPNGDVGFHQANNFYGTILADGLSMDQGTNMYMDGGLMVCDDELADAVGAMASTSTGAISSSGQYFGQWFTDVPGTNISVRHTLTLTRNASGIYEYLDNAFFPIDGELFGNEGDAHNFNFTFAFHAEFEHEQCAERFFEFFGADDVWVYIDGQLAMDLGGIMPLEEQVIEIDRLGLVDGETYTLHFYYAQRNPNESIFRLRTDLPLVPQPTYTATAPFD